VTNAAFQSCVYYRTVVGNLKLAVESSGQGGRNATGRNALASEKIRRQCLENLSEIDARLLLNVYRKLYMAHRLSITLFTVVVDLA